MRYANIEWLEIINGEGLGMTLWVQGCSLNCKGCHNPSTQDFNSGTLYTGDVEREILSALESKHITRFTVSGGNSTELQNIDTIHALCYNIKTKFPDKSIWLWSGHYLREIQKCPIKRKILDVVDTVVDGRFVQELYDPSLLWCGSSNQSVLKKGTDF